jgi:hypothetical protein
MPFPNIVHLLFYQNHAWDQVILREKPASLVVTRTKTLTISKTMMIFGKDDPCTTLRIFHLVDKRFVSSKHSHKLYNRMYLASSRYLPGTSICSIYIIGLPVCPYVPFAHSPTSIFTLELKRLLSTHNSVTPTYFSFLPRPVLVKSEA